ncbi:unnamed protein product, partial [Pleuronectes platessa]
MSFNQDVTFKRQQLICIEDGDRGWGGRAVHSDFPVSCHRQHAAALLHSDWLVLGPGAERSRTQATEQVESQDRRGQRSLQGQTGVRPGHHRPPLELTQSQPTASLALWCMCAPTEGPDQISIVRPVTRIQTVQREKSPEKSRGQNFSGLPQPTPPLPPLPHHNLHGEAHLRSPISSSPPPPPPPPPPAHYPLIPHNSLLSSPLSI